MASDKTTHNDVVILGASYGGASTAHYLLRHAVPALPKSANVRVVLVSSSKEIYCRPAGPRAIISDDQFDQKKLFVSVASQFAQYPKDSFSFVHAVVTKVDHAARTVTVRRAGEGGESVLPYFSLVIATGSSTRSPLYTLGGNDTDALRASWAQFRKQLATAKNIVIAGGGPTGVETAAELAEHFNGRPGWLHGAAKEPKVKVTLVTSAAHILPQLRPAIADKGAAIISKLGVTVITGKKVTAVSPDDAGASADNLASAAKVTLSDGSVLDADLYIPATGISYNTGFLDSALLAADGRVAVDGATLRAPAAQAGERVYAVGDVGNYSRDAILNIFAAVPVVAGNVKRDLLLAFDKAKAPAADKTFKEEKRETQMVILGKGTGVGAVMGWKLPGFAVHAIKGDYWLSYTPKIWSGKQFAKES